MYQINGSESASNCQTLATVEIVFSQSVIHSTAKRYLAQFFDRFGFLGRGAAILSGMAISRRWKIHACMRLQRIGSQINHFGQ